jgi:hypothetical protein
MGEYELLSKIKSPYDVKKLNDEQLEKLCTEIREKLVETVSVTEDIFHRISVLLNLPLLLSVALICRKTALYGMSDIRHIPTSC